MNVKITPYNLLSSLLILSNLQHLYTISIFFNEEVKIVFFLILHLLRIEERNIEGIARIRYVLTSLLQLLGLL